jgi:CheY-like chemotaxis protein
MGAIPQVIGVSPDSGNRNALRSILSRQDCNTKFVSTIRECDQILSEQDVDLVFCDRILTRHISSCPRDEAVWETCPRSRHLAIWPTEVSVWKRFTTALSILLRRHARLTT